MKISNFIISMVLVSLVVGVFALFYQGLSNNYSGSFDNSTFASYDKLEDLEEQQEQINSTLQQLRGDTGSNPINFASAFIASAWQVIRTTFTSFDIFTDMITNNFSNSQFGESMNLFQISLLMIGFILFAFAVISILVGRDT